MFCRAFVYTLHLRPPLPHTIYINPLHKGRSLFVRITVSPAYWISKGPFTVRDYENQRETFLRCLPSMLLASVTEMGYFQPGEKCFSFEGLRIRSQWAITKPKAKHFLLKKMSRLQWGEKVGSLQDHFCLCNLSVYRSLDLSHWDQSDYLFWRCQFATSLSHSQWLSVSWP